MAPRSFYNLFSALIVEKCKQLIFLCIFGIFLCIIKWLGATLKTYFYQKIQIKYCSRDQNANKSQPTKQIYDKRCFLNMSNYQDQSKFYSVVRNCKHFVHKVRHRGHTYSLCWIVIYFACFLFGFYVNLSVVTN